MTAEGVVTYCVLIENGPLEPSDPFYILRTYMKLI